ncbi:MAG: hypothetical protein HY744_27755 [Deltaproteobacteria bacterium]|nr:hypothetical protein [Deltaproteobacteria bacterium]
MRHRLNMLLPCGLAALALLLAGGCGEQFVAFPPGATGSGGAGTGGGTTGGSGPGSAADGEPCGGPADCQSGHCPAEDGVCCESACDRPCEACLAPKTGVPDGTCGPVSAGKDPDGECPYSDPWTCGPDGTGCNGNATSPACKLYGPGTKCAAPSCSAGVQSAASVCNGSGNCVSGGAGLPCSPYVCDPGGMICLQACAGTSDCQAGFYCDTAGGTCAALVGLGAACIADEQCQSGHCPPEDGVCCDSACDAACVACENGKTGAPSGTCASVLAGQDPDTDCPAADPATCGIAGTGCNGAAQSPACLLYGANTVCAPSTCNSGTQSGPSLCDGKGKCGLSSIKLCKPYVCDKAGKACLGSCQAYADCAAGYYCDFNFQMCVGQGKLGDPCSSPLQCASGACADGYCCDGACGGACDACAMAKGAVKDGTCTVLGKGSAGSPSCSPYLCNGQSAGCPGWCGGDPDCAAGYQCISGQCIGKKLNGQSCAKAAECQSGFCVNGYCCNSACGNPCDRCNLNPAGTCKAVSDGTAGDPSCSPYLCDGFNFTCPAWCSWNGDCVPGASCLSNKCIVIKDDGAACGGDKECKSGFCSDGVCCNSACTGSCNACSQAAGSSKDGSCEAIKEGQACKDDLCMAGQSCQAGVCKGGLALKPDVYFEEDFADNSAGWLLGNEWQIGPAKASAPTNCAGPDPAQDHTPSGDNGVAGVAIGGNASTTVHDWYWLTSPVIDASGANALYIELYRWLNTDFSPYMLNHIEVYDGSKWVQVWECCLGFVCTSDKSWQHVWYDIAQFKNAKLQVRIGFKTAQSVLAVSSWNVDDLFVTSAPCH